MFDFNDEKVRVEEKVNTLIQKSNQIGNIKIVVFLAGVLLFLYNREVQTTISWFVFLFLCVIFCGLLVYHKKLLKQKEYVEAKQGVINKYLLRFEGKWTSFPDTGTEFLTGQSYLERDLDLFGEKSLYQYLCVANTVEGKKHLAEYLTQQSMDYEKIQENKAAIEELINKHDFRLKIETLSALSKKQHTDTKNDWYYNFIQYLEDATSNQSFVLKKGINIILVVTLLIFLCAIRNVLPYAALIVPLLTQMVIAYLVSYKNRDAINKLNRFCLGLDSIIEILEEIAKEPFQSPMLTKLQSDIHGDVSLMTGIKKLSRIKDKFSMQMNVYIHVFLQIFFMCDVHCVREFEKWKSVYGKNFQKIYAVIGDIEAFLSLSSFALEKEVTFPEIINEEKPIFEADEIYHPLLDSKKVVPNTITVTKGVNIITGSNMSGKSTFMRTLGINMILAYAGAPVCAKNMRISMMKPYTCMRVTDDVFMGRSSFYAEVLRIKTIVEASREQSPMFVIIDEIFKGTNSIDRITGAKEIIKKLCKPHIIVFISTHDLEICTLIDSKELPGDNYHFLESYDRNQILFDYKIKDGKCKSRNAKYILKMAGLLD